MYALYYYYPNRPWAYKRWEYELFEERPAGDPDGNWRDAYQMTKGSAFTRRGCDAKIVQYLLALREDDDVEVYKVELG